MQRQPEIELMDIQAEVDAYANADFAEVNQRFAERLVELWNASGAAPGPVLAVDLGTGPGDIPVRVGKLLPAIKIKAIDASQPMLEVALRTVGNAKLIERIELICSDALKTPLPDKCADIVFSNSILHHVRSAAQFWTEVARIAKPGALIFIRDLARPATIDAAAALVFQHAGGESIILREEFFRSLLSAYTVEEVEQQLRESKLNGLSVAMASDRHLDIYGQIK